MSILTEEYESKRTETRRVGYKCDFCDDTNFDGPFDGVPWDFHPNGWLMLAEGGDPYYKPVPKLMCGDCRKERGL